MQSLETLTKTTDTVQEQPDEGTNQQKSLKKAYERLLSDALNRVYKRENADIQREIKREGFDKWVVEYYKEPSEVMEKNLLPVILSYYEAKDGEITPETEQKARDLCRIYAINHNKSALSSVLDGKELQIDDVELLWKEMEE
jgi:hypothetical protein